MTTTTTPPPPAVFAINPEQMTAYLARCQAREYGNPPPTPEPEDECQEISFNWNPGDHLCRVEWLLREAFDCGAITSRVPGFTIGFDTSDDDMGDPWYKWLVDSAGLNWCATQAAWTEAVHLGGGTGQGTARVQAVFEEAVSICNDLAAQSRITSGGPALALLCPPGITPGELLNYLTEMADDAIWYRAPENPPDCNDCQVTYSPDGQVTEVIYCGDHADDDLRAGSYRTVKQHLDRIQEGKL